MADQRYPCHGCGRFYFQHPRTKTGERQYCRRCVREGSRELRQLGLPTTKKAFDLFVKTNGIQALEGLVEEIEAGLTAERN